MLYEFEDHLFIVAVMRSEFNGNFQHVLAEQRHPCRAICLFEIATSRQRSAAVENTNIVEAEESSLENILAKPIFTVHPPGEVQQQFVECLS